MTLHKLRNVFWICGDVSPIAYSSFGANVLIIGISILGEMGVPLLMTNKVWDVTEPMFWNFNKPIHYFSGDNLLYSPVQISRILSTLISAGVV